LNIEVGSEEFSNGNNWKITIIYNYRRGGKEK